MSTRPNRASLEVAATPTAPSIVRAWLRDSIDFGPARGAELALLGSEMVTSTLLDANLAADERIRVSTEPILGGLELAVSVNDPTRSELPIGDLTKALLDQLASRWGRRREGDTSTVWAEVRKPGARADLSAAPDEDLLERAAVDGEARAEVFRRWLPMAHKICRRYQGAGVDPQDLEQVAALALLKAARRYDPASGHFEHYASVTVSGELKRHLRDRGWSVRVPRGLKESALEVTRSRSDLSQRLGRAPDVDDISEEVGLDPNDVRKAMDAGAAYRASSLDRPRPDAEADSRLLDRLGSEDRNLIIAEQWHAVAPAIRRLPDRERRIIYLRFFEDMTQSEIAAEVGVSQMHVSRLLARSIDKLRSMTE